MTYDRDELLRRVALDELCDDLLGPRKGRGRSGSWSCPSSDHGPQTGRTPPLTTFTSRSNEQRWRCHACGAGGTALDLAMVSQQLDFKDAIEFLARRAGLGATDWSSAPPLRRLTAPPNDPFPVPPPNTAIDGYVAACESLLMAPNGAAVRRWLLGRGFSLPILAANRIGADPGARKLPRAKGLPRGGPGAVFPVLQDRHAVYAQLRYLRPGQQRWVNPSGQVAPSPHLARVRLAQPPRRPDLLIVTEGMTDALTVADAGCPAVALLGVGLADRRMALTLAQRWPIQHLVVAFDAGNSGRRASAQFVALLAEVGAANRTSVLELPRAVDDLNEWRQVGGCGFRSQLSQALPRPRSVKQELGRTAPPATPDRGLGLS